MGRKRKASRQALEPTGPKEVDPADARLHINSFEDVADSEEEHFINRDKILLEDGPRAKRHKSQKEEEIFESSDEEVLGFEDDDDDDDDLASEANRPQAEEVDEGGDNDYGYWGASKREYYETDALDTEADALAEEAEAKRLQQKKLARMAEADFVFDGHEWAATKEDAPGGGDVTTEVLGEVDVSPDMGPEEVYRVLQARYPEFDFLVDEFQTMRSQLKAARKAAEDRPPQSLEAVRYWVLGCYVASIASYFAILTSPARDGDAQQKTLDPAALRDHEVMETLVRCREAWSRVKVLRSRRRSSPVESSPPAQAARVISHQPDSKERSVSGSNGGGFLLDGKQKSGKTKSVTKAEKKKMKELEASLAGLSGLLVKPNRDERKAGNMKSKDLGSAVATRQGTDGDDNSDFGDEENLDARTAEDKAARRKSLRFYTSQIVQKAGRRAGAGRDAGGDVDIPHRERLRDRQARLNKEAERRGQKNSKLGADLGGDSDEEDAALASGVRDGEDEYYDMVAHASRQKRADKAARSEALKAAGRLDRVVEEEQIGEDGKRQVSYTILKNKGLAPRRKKEVRNPRVKKRKKFEEKQKKLKSIRAVYGGGEGRGGYQGELSGIKTGLVKSVKLGG